MKEGPWERGSRNRDTPSQAEKLKRGNSALVPNSSQADPALTVLAAGRAGLPVGSASPLSAEPAGAPGLGAGLSPPVSDPLQCSSPSAPAPGT